jgi:hypothetical protein
VDRLDVGRRTSTEDGATGLDYPAWQAFQHGPSSAPGFSSSSFCSVPMRWGWAILRSSRTSPTSCVSPSLEPGPSPGLARVVRIVRCLLWARVCLVLPSALEPDVESRGRSDDQDAPDVGRVGDGRWGGSPDERSFRPGLCCSSRSRRSSRSTNGSCGTTSSSSRSARG